MTLERISTETKIPRRHLEALEQDRLSELLPAFYQRSEVRAYARAAGLDESRALARLHEQLTPVSVPDIPEAPSRAAIRPPSPPTLVAFGAIVLAVALMSRATSSPASRATRPAASPTPAESVRGEQAPLQEEQVAPLKEEQDVVPAATPYEPPDPQPEPVAESAELVVTTEPTGARVTVNGVGWGVSPVRIRYLPLGSKRVRVSKTGYGTEERSVQLDGGGPHELDIMLASAR